MSSILSVNVGAPEALRSHKRPTGIVKMPVDSIDVADPGPKRAAPDGAGFSGVAGDYIGSGQHHGGSGQAVYAVAREELDHWGDELDRELPNGMFGENLTTRGLDVDAAEVGDIWRVGTAVLRASGPRVPCSKFATRMGERQWVRRFADRGRVGVYLAVDQPGRITVGDAIAVERSASGLSIPTLLRAWLGDQDAMREALACELLDEESRIRFAKKVG